MRLIGKLQEMKELHKHIENFNEVLFTSFKLVTN